MVEHGHLYRACDYFLFIDKLKLPDQINFLWNNMNFPECTLTEKKMQGKALKQRKEVNLSVCESNFTIKVGTNSFPHHFHNFSAYFLMDAPMNEDKSISKTLPNPASGIIIDDYLRLKKIGNDKF